MPSLNSHILYRQRVVTAMEDALSSFCLAVLIAPLGHGKTTASQQLLRRWDKRAFYLKIKPGWQDNAGYLWAQVCAMLEEQGLPDVDALKLIGLPDDDARMYHCLAFFRKLFSDSPTLLVLDDFHNLDETSLNRLFESLASEEIPAFNMLVLSRTKPDLPLAYLEMKGYATVLDSRVLDFSREEARQLFEIAGEHAHEPVDAALEFSQGWAAALRLCLQRYLTDNTVKPVKDIEQLVSDTFFATYAKEDQCLLLQLSILGTFSTEQALFITGKKDAPIRLKKLCEKNAFLQYSPSVGTYSIHALLRVFLLENLLDSSLADCGVTVQALHRRAAQCYMQSQNYTQAIRFFAQAGEDDDLLQILRMFETPGQGFFILVDPETVLGIIEDIPWELRLRSPIGYLGFVHRYAVRVSREKAAGLMHEAHEHFLDAASMPEALQRRVRGEMELVRAVLSFNDIDAICECYQKADALLERSSLVDKNMFWTYNCPHSAFLYLKEPGRYAFLERLVTENLPHFQRISGGANAGAIELLSAERLLETGKSHTMEDLLHTAKYKALESEQYSLAVAVNFTLARHQLAQGNTKGIYDIFDLLRKPVEQRSHPLLLLNLEVCLGYVAAVCNDIDRVPAWVLQHEPLTVRNNQAHTFLLIVRGKAIVALRNWPRLQAFADEIEPRINDLGSVFGRLHVLIFKSVAALNLQKHTMAMGEKYLSEALALAEPDGILTSIAEYGSHIYPLLQRLAYLHPEKRALGQLRRLTKQYANLGKNRASKLTLHEKDIMQMVRAGATNKEIGVSLGITQGSVANTLSRIYGKLGVGSRIEAINKWTEEADEA